MTPQEKKRLSLKKDCRNTYGENDKSSRKSIRLRKRSVNRSYRREVRQVIDFSDEEGIQSETQSVQRKNWKKCSDMPLGEKMLRDANWGIEHDIWQIAQGHPNFNNDLEDFLTNQVLTISRHRVIKRRALAVALDRCSASLDLNIEDIKILELFLSTMKPIKMANKAQ